MRAEVSERENCGEQVRNRATHDRDVLEHDAELLGTV